MHDLLNVSLADKHYRYGYFDPEHREYVITDPRTPMPWMNYLFNEEYVALISATAGGYSFHLDARDKRILRFRNNSLPMDRPGRYLYLRDQCDGDYWSATWAPVQRDPEARNFECRHGFGYTRISHARNCIQSTTTYLVPPDANLEIWSLQLENNSGRDVELQVFPYAEFCVWLAQHDLANQQWSYNIVRCQRKESVIHHLTHTTRYGKYAFFASSAEPAGWDCDRERFIGRCRSESNPQVVEQGHCTNADCFHGNPIAAFEIPVALRAGERRELVFILGTAGNPASGSTLLDKYLRPGICGELIPQLRARWDAVLASQIVETPDADTNLCLNQWHPYQAQVTFRVSRGPSIYEGGIGRGMGFRDSCQDTLGVAHVQGKQVRQLLLNLTQNLYQAGNSRHQYFRLTGQGEGGGNLDTHLWLLPAVCHYLRESGDWEFLQENVAYCDGGNDTVLEHLKRTLEFSWTHRGAHKLPLLGNSDWNDGLQCPGPNRAAESVFIAMQLALGYREMALLAKHLNDSALVTDCDAKAAEITRLLNERCWDGDWYLRAYDDNGHALGCHANLFGKIFLNPQTWAVMSQVATPERGLTAMDSVARHLNSLHGVAKVWPAWQEFDPAVGGMTDCVAGLKENGGIFCHTNSWVVIAEAMLGRGDAAYEYYAKLRPTRRDGIQELHEAEPYVYCQTIAGPEHPRFGLGRNSWLTGAVAWMYVAATQHILGIRPEFDGLRVDPCIPSAWDSFRVTRQFRGATYRITVCNPEHVSSGIVSLHCAGRKISGNLLPVLAHGESCDAIAVMGTAGIRN